MKLDSEIVLKGEDASKFREMLFDLDATNERDAFIAKTLSDEDREKLSEHTEVLAVVQKCKAEMPKDRTRTALRRGDV